MAQRADQITALQLDLLFLFTDEEKKNNLAKATFHKIKEKNPITSLELLHYVAHQDIAVAEELAAEFIAGEDSEVKKGAIVMLIRHESTKGKGMVDESFKGKPPRKTMYSFVDGYNDGSEAAALYRRLSTHDYQETGKTWPPSYLKNGPSAEEITEWKRFIDTYPWFPGTDDAYYRLAFSQFAQADYQGSLATIKSYLARQYWPDNDAKPFIMNLLRNLVLTVDVSDPEMPFIQHLKNIAANPLATMIAGPRQNIGAIIDSINWFLSNPKYIHFLNTDVNTLNLMLEVAKTIQVAPLDSTARLVAAKIESADSSHTKMYDEDDNVLPEGNNIAEKEASSEEENEDEYLIPIGRNCSRYGRADIWDDFPSASLVKSVLYASFIEVKHPEPSALKLNVPDDPAERAIREMALTLNSRFSGLSIEDARSGKIDELLILAILHAGYDFEQWEQDFKITRDFLSNLNNRHIPSVISKRYQNLFGKG